MLKITGYSDKYAVHPGEKVEFYINSEDNRIKVKGTKLIFKRNWVTNKDKMKGIFSILKNLHKAYTKK